MKTTKAQELVKARIEEITKNIKHEKKWLFGLFHGELKTYLEICERHIKSIRDLENELKELLEETK